jgi:hypothetical protein
MVAGSVPSQPRPRGLLDCIRDRLREAVTLTDVRRFLQRFRRPVTVAVTHTVDVSDQVKALLSTEVRRLLDEHDRELVAQIRARAQ